jgi:hypothetical protein
MLLDKSQNAIPTIPVPRFSVLKALWPELPAEVFALTP